MARLREAAEVGPRHQGCEYCGQPGVFEAHLSIPSLPVEMCRTPGCVHEGRHVLVMKMVPNPAQPGRFVAAPVPFPRPERPKRLR